MISKLIADAGSTKVEWCLVGDDGNVRQRFRTEGINALMIDKDQLDESLKIVKEKLGNESVEDEIHYYGAGCATPEICQKIMKALHRLFPGALVYVYSDLLGAARALCGHKPGIACILGTGSNSSLYDGSMIINNVPSLGFILGDEGSGAALGKRLVSDAFKGHLPEIIRENFLSTYSLTLADILNKVYRESCPNKFLASLVPFLKENIWNPYIYSLVLEEFKLFVKRNVAMYIGAHSLPINFTGSIAYNFDNILREAVTSQGYKVNQITQSPMEGLIKYHVEK